MLKLRSREASAIVKFVFLILLDLAGQFVDFVSFDGGVEQGEGTFWPLPPNLLHAKPKHSALNPIWHQRFCTDKICAWQKLVFPSMKAWKSSIFSKRTSLKHDLAGCSPLFSDPFGCEVNGEPCEQVWACNCPTWLISAILLSYWLLRYSSMHLSAFLSLHCYSSEESRRSQFLNFS